jgi:putative transposase
LYQGRFKSFPIEQDEHFFTVCRYVERNALRANMVSSAGQWRWCSLWHRINEPGSLTLAEWPLARGDRWLEYVNQAETKAELKALQRSAWSGTPFGNTLWQRTTAKRLGLESTLRSPGRPMSRKGQNITGK